MHAVLKQALTHLVNPGIYVSIGIRKTPRAWENLLSTLAPRVGRPVIILVSTEGVTVRTYWSHGNRAVRNPVVALAFTWADIKSKNLPL
jgi:hypothetical protein